MNTCTKCIWEDFNQPLKKFIHKRIANEYDAEDILQEVFVKIHNNLDNLMNEDRIHSWIYTITRNTITNYYRSNRNDVDITELHEDLESNNDDGISLNTQIASCLKEMTERMPEKYKEAILLTEFQNMTQRELSEKLGISISGAKSRVQRGRAMLKEMLLECCNFEFDRFGNIIDYKPKKD